MFRVPRKRIGAGDLARDFVWRTFKTADRTLGDCTDSIRQILLKNGFRQEDFPALLERERLRNAYFLGLLAMGIVDLGNSVDNRTALRVGETLQQLLRFPSGIGARSAAALVADHLRAVEAEAAEMPAHEAIALRMMRHIGATESGQARAPFRNPLSVTALSRQLVAAGTGWWSGATEQVKVAA